MLLSKIFTCLLGKTLKSTDDLQSTACSNPIFGMHKHVKEAIAEQELVPGSDFFFVLDCLATEFHSEVAPGQGSAKKGQVSSFNKCKSSFHV